MNSILLSLILACAVIDPALKDALDVSVTVVGSDGQGSGMLVTRMVCGDQVSFVWTAAHGVEGSRISANKFTDLRVIQEFDTGKVEYQAKVIRYDATADLALLRICRPNTFSVSTKFDDSGLSVGEPVWHVGSFGGTALPHSVTDGIVSAIDRHIVDDVWTQVSAIAQPGSSGSGVFRKSDGSCIGMVIRCKPGITLIHPISQMRGWAKAAGVEWAIDDTVEMPTDQSLTDLPIEDVVDEAEAVQLFKFFFNNPPTPTPTPAPE